MTKQEIRKVYLEKRRKLSDSEYERLSRKCCSLFFDSIALESFRVVHTFLPIKKNREPDTWRIIARIQIEHPKIKLSVPKVTEKGIIESYYYHEPSDLVINSWGIPEPTQGDMTPHSEIDLVLVPMLAFDLTGQRVGYGKGYYDRFLTECRADCRTVGLCFFPPENKIDNLLPGDVPLQQVITPEKVFVFNKR